MRKVEQREKCAVNLTDYLKYSLQGSLDIEAAHGSTNYKELANGGSAQIYLYVKETEEGLTEDSLTCHKSQ